MKVICKFNNRKKALPENCPTNFDYGLILEKEYTVMGLVIYRDSNCLYYLIDEDGRPSWFPHQIFETRDNSLPSNWFVRINPKKLSSDIYAIWGFDELCNDIYFYDNLMDRNEEAMRTYFRHKIELEKEYENYS